MNSALKAQVQSLQGSIVGQAEKVSMPDRFVVNEVPDMPQVWIIDSETGRKTVVSLYAYGAVRQVLSDLFK